MSETNNKVFDSRVVERYIAKGIVKQSDLEARLKNLEDSEEVAEWVHMDLHDTMMSEDDDELEENVLEVSADDETEEGI